MSDIIQTAFITSALLTTYLVIQNYWYPDILEKLPEAIIFAISSWIFYSIIIIIIIYSSIIIYNNSVSRSIFLIWIGLWLARCYFVVVNEPYSPLDTALTFLSLLVPASLIYIFWTYYL